MKKEERIKEEIEMRKMVELSKSEQVRLEVEVLLEKGLLVRDVAKIMGVYYQDVVKIRKGERNLRDKTAVGYLDRLSNPGEFLESEIETKESAFELLVKKTVRQELENINKK